MVENRRKDCVLDSSQNKDYVNIRDFRVIKIWSHFSIASNIPAERNTYCGEMNDAGDGDDE